MVKLAFRPDADGFAFSNSFVWDNAERAIIAPLAAQLVPVVVAHLVPDPTVVVAATAAVSGYIQYGGPMDIYGLCGGMCYAALDHWRSRTLLPRGSEAEPTRGASASNAVRGLIWDRLVDSLTVGGALQTTLEWMLWLHVVPEFLGGGGPWLKAQSLVHWQLLKEHIDHGEPWPIGLVGSTPAAWSQHQVLVYGYLDNGQAKTLFIYDPNDPRPHGDPDDSIMTLDFSGSSLSGTVPSFSNGIGALRGFFCSRYLPLQPPPGLATAYGKFVRYNTEAQVWMMADGARFGIADPAELAALGGSMGDVLTLLGPKPQSEVAPRDGAMLRERSGAAVLLYQGGAPFHLPDPVWVERFGGWGAVRVVPDNTLWRFRQPPRDGTLLREFSDPKVYLIENGQRRWITTPAELAPRGDFPSVRVVPDGALAGLPIGPIIPTPAANECALITAELGRLEARVAKQEARVAELEDPQDPRAAAAAKGALARTRAELARLRSRAAVLGCQ